MVDDPEARRLARIYVWWQPAETTLANPRKLLCQILHLGRSEDYLGAERIRGAAALRAALLGALPGDIDPKSEHFWRLRFGLDHEPRGDEMTEFSREEIHAAWERRMELQDADDWKGFGLTFTEDAVYHEHHYGIFRGRKAILEWLVPVMQYCKDWTYPVEWVNIDGNRVVHKWLNRLPGKRADGSFYEFAGFTAMEYAGNGQFSFQEDIYNRIETDKIIEEWRAATGGKYK